MPDGAAGSSGSACSTRSTIHARPRRRHGVCLAAVGDQAVEATDDARVVAGLELVGITKELPSQKTDPAAGGEHGFGGGRGPPRCMPADRVVERVDDEALPEFAEREVDERCPLDPCDNEVGEHAGQTGDRGCHVALEQATRRLREALVAVDDVLEHRATLATGLERRPPAGEFPPG